MSSEPTCPECGGDAIFRHRYVQSGAPLGPKLLPDLGGLGEYGTFTVFVCTDCGSTRFFADGSARSQLAGWPGWRRVT